TKPDGQKIVRRLLEKADVVIQNFRPGVLNRYGLDYGALHEAYPRLIYLSISAYGQTGPLSDRPGFDPVLQGESGMMSVNGEANGEGLRHAIAVVDTMTGIHAVAAINAALYARTSTGKGQHIDLALYDTALACLGNMGSYYLVGDVPMIGSNYRFSDTPVDDSRPPPSLGEHTETVLKEIAGLADADVKALREKKVIG